MKKLNFLFKKAYLVAFAAVMGLTMVSALPGSVQTAQAAGAREYENPPCYDITGTTTALNISGVPNGGTMNFDDAGVGAGYQACVRMSTNDPTTALPARLEGWVWNSNLGWVSLYCPGGAGAMNLGAACGTEAYSVTFATTQGAFTLPDLATVKLDGYGWGDNIGYISFKTTLSQIAPIANGINKGLVTAATMGDAASHAWTDSVGWLNLTGMRMYWYDTDPPIPGAVNASICSSQDTTVPATATTGVGCLCNLITGCTQTDATRIPNADNSQRYIMTIPMVDSGVKLTNAQVQECSSSSVGVYTTAPGSYAYCAKITPVWEDDVDLDQTTVASQSQATPKFNATSSSTGGTGAVTKPLNSLSGPDSFGYDAVNSVWFANVRSFAPTSDRNTFDGMSNEKFYYAQGIDAYNKNLTGQNRLVLKELRVMLFKYSPDGVTAGNCVYGTINGSNCDIRAYFSNVSLGFKPLWEVTKLAYKKASSWINFIAVDSIENKLEFDYQAASQPGVVSPLTTLYVGLENPGVFAMQFVDSFPSTSDNVTNKNSIDIGNTTEQFPIGQIFSSSPADVITADAGPYVYSKITYGIGAKSVAFFGSKLPRIKGGLLLNPVAKVQGNVYATDVLNKAADITIRSLGNVSSNLRREAVVRNVAKYTSGFVGSVVSGGIHTVNNLNAVTGLSVLVEGKVYYLKGGTLVLDCGTTCTFNNNITFIVENGSIRVNSDLKAAAGTNAQIGLIALRDLTVNAQNEGFIYVDKTVTWLNNVQIFADRLLSTYDKTTAIFDANGLPRMTGDDYMRQSTFNNQLVLEGTVSSQNGIGNASRAIPVDENGKALPGAGSICSDYGTAPVAGICRARVADLNYLRYFGPGLELCTGSEGVGALANTPRDQALKADAASGMGCNPNYAGYAVDASGLYAASSTSSDNGPGFDLVLGNGGGSSSAYFGAGSPTFANSFPVNFFYKPIAKDLPGFEVDQNFNPINQ